MHKIIYLMIAIFLIVGAMAQFNYDYNYNFREGIWDMMTNGNLSGVNIEAGNISVESIVLTGEKYIRPVQLDGGYSLLFQSLQVLSAGGFPFIWVAQDSLNRTIVPFWLQNGRNNSFSGQMNSFGTIPKSWITFSGSPIGNDSSGIEFLFNRSDYIKYCNYLKTNLSIVDTGCRYFADTSGRLVPLLFGGDLEVHRTAFIHEGMTVREDMNIIDLNESTFDVIGGAMHIRQTATREVGIPSGKNFQSLDKDFELGTFAPDCYQITNYADDWLITTDVECNGDFCTHAGPSTSNNKIFRCDFSGNDINLENVLFYIDTNQYTSGGSFEVLIGNATQNTSLYTLTTTDTIGIKSVLLGTTYDNQSELYLYFEHLSTHPTRGEVWIDDILVNGTTINGDQQNVTCLDSIIKFGDGEVDVNGIPLQGIYYNCTGSVIQIIGNVSQTTVVSENVTGNSEAENFIARTEFIGDINWTYLKNYPAACPGGSAITALGDSVTCTAFGGAGGGNTTEEMIDAVNNTALNASKHTGMPIYMTCGENSALDPGAEWSCGGNGETNQNVYVYEDVTITGMSLDCNTGTGVANVTIQVSETNADCWISSSAVQAVSTCNLDVDAGSWIRPYTVADSGHSQCVVGWRMVTR